MKKTLKILAVVIVLGLVAGIATFFGIAPTFVASTLNSVITPPPYQVSERARELHDRLLIADLHSDSLVWGYDLNEKQDHNHVDVPRLIEGNVSIQAFTVVTKSPRGLNIDKNNDESDNIFWLALAQRQPIENLSSLTKRALWQASKLKEYAMASQGKLVIITNKRDLADLTERRRTQKIVGGWLGIEGAHALDGNVDNVEILFNAGFRMMSPSHFFDSEMGGSAHGVEKYGLTEKGKEMIRRMEEKRMLVDLAHASSKTIDDVLKIATRPVVVSHTGVKGTCNNNRNLSDDQLKRIASTRGLIGIGFWDTAVCGHDAVAISKAIKYAADLVGVDHVALGSDYDGAVRVPFDVTGEALITEALLGEGLSEEDTRKIMGGNVYRLLAENLPEQ